MARRKLPEDVVITDIVTSLSKPTDYVRGIVGSMVEYQREHGPSIVRIGTTGRGHQPNYRLEPKVEESLGYAEDFAKWSELAAFNGSSHKRAWNFIEVKGEHWSSRAMEFAEVQALLGALRGFANGKAM